MEENKRLDGFPCERLCEWAAQKGGYTEALNRLQRMKEDVSG